MVVRAGSRGTASPTGAATLVLRRTTRPWQATQTGRTVAEHLAGNNAKASLSIAIWAPIWDGRPGPLISAPLSSYGIVHTCLGTGHRGPSAPGTLSERCPRPGESE